MPSLREGRLVFNFPDDGSDVAKYDDWSFYRNQFQRVCRRAKAVDFVFVETARTWLIEAKDYRHQRRTKVVDLPCEVAAKIRDTLAGLAACRCTTTKTSGHRGSCLVDSEHRCRTASGARIRPRNCFHVADRAGLTQKLKQLLKPVDPHPRIVDRQSLHDDALEGDCHSSPAPGRRATRRSRSRPGATVTPLHQNLQTTVNLQADLYAVAVSLAKIEDLSHRGRRWWGLQPGRKHVHESPCVGRSAGHSLRIQSGENLERFATAGRQRLVVVAAALHVDPRAHQRFSSQLSLPPELTDAVASEPLGQVLLVQPLKLRPSFVLLADDDTLGRSPSARPRERPNGS